MVTRQSFRRIRRKIELSRLKESGLSSGSQSKLGPKWIAAAVLSGVSFVAGTLGATLSTEFSKDIHVYMNARFGLFESRPTLKYSSPEVSKPFTSPLAVGSAASASMMSEYLAPVTISNDDYRDAKDVEVLVNAPTGCILNAPSVLTTPSGIAGLMHITDTFSSGKDSDDIAIKLLQKNQKLVLTFNVSCGQKNAPVKLDVHFSDTNCRPILSKISRLLRNPGLAAVRGMPTGNPYETEAKLGTISNPSTRGRVLSTSLSLATRNAPVWGQVIDMGGQDSSTRPSFLTIQLANSDSLPKVLATEQLGTKAGPLSASIDEAAAMLSFVRTGRTTAFLSQLLSMQDLGITTKDLVPLQEDQIVHFAGQSRTVDVGGEDDGQEALDLLAQRGTAALRPAVLSTSRSNTNPTWNEAYTTDDGLRLPAAHYIQSFAFTDDEAASRILFNLSRFGRSPIDFAAGDLATQLASSALVSAFAESRDEVGGTTAFSQRDDMAAGIYYTTNGIVPLLHGDDATNYAYDAVGNPISISNGAVATYTYDTADRTLLNSSDLENNAHQRKHVIVRFGRGKEAAEHRQFSFEDRLAPSPKLRLAQRQDEPSVDESPAMFQTIPAGKGLTVSLLKDGHAHLRVTVDPRLGLARDVSGDSSDIEAILVKTGGANLTVTVNPKREVDAACKGEPNIALTKGNIERFSTPSLSLD